jgi:hypothetical protein
VSLADGQSYQWRVRAHDGEDNGSWCDIWIFTIDISAPGVPENIITSPTGWTNVSVFSINWTNPIDTSGIVTGGYYKIGTPPEHSTDGTWVGTKPIAGITVSSEGSNTIYIWLKDNLGHIDHLKYGTINYYYDATPPPAPPLNSSTHKNDTWTADENLRMDWETPADFGIVGYSYVLDQNQSTRPDTTIDTIERGKTFKYLADGIWYFHIRAEDLASNWGETGHYTIKVDTNGPSGENAIISFNNSSKISNSVNLVVKWSNFVDINGSGIAGYYYTAYGTTHTGQSWTIEPECTLIAKGESTVTIYIHAEDNIGNEGNYANASIKINFPNVVDFRAAPNVLRTESITLTAVCFDAVDPERMLSGEFQYREEGGIWKTLSSLYFTVDRTWQVQFTPSATAPLGSYEARVRFTNLNGTTTPWETTTFTVLNNEPIINYNDEMITGNEDDQITINLSSYGSDIETPQSEFKWQVILYDNTKITNITISESAPFTLTVTPLRDWYGTTIIDLQLTDGDGDTDLAYVQLEWAPVNDAPTVKSPIADFSIDEDHQDSTTVNLNAVFDDIDSPKLNYTVSGNENIKVTINPDGSVLFVPFENWTGSNDITFSASDGIAPDVAETVVVTIKPVNDVPVAIIDSSIRTSVLGKYLDLTGTGYDIDGNITEYSWTSDIDGALSSSQTLDLSELTHGVHTLSFSVKDNDGAWSAPLSIQFTITAPDVIVDKIELSSGDITEGDAVTLKAVISNQGDADANNVKVMFYDGDEIIGEKIIDVITEGTSEEVSITWEPDRGEHNLRVKIDPYDEDVSEVDTSNNQMEKSITVNRDWTPVIIAIIIVIIIAIILIFMLLRSRKERKEDLDTISEIEKELEEAKKLGLPTAEIEKILSEAKQVREVERKTDQVLG